jgi:hypothetical protein
MVDGGWWMVDGGWMELSTNEMQAATMTCGIDGLDLLLIQRRCCRGAIDRLRRHWYGGSVLQS